MYTYDVILAAYNGEKFIEQQIDSILNQSVQPQHIFIRDDASSDNTCVILNKFNNIKNITIIRGEYNLGYVKNFECLVSKTTSDIVFFSDQDDVWLPNKAEILLSELYNNESSTTVFSDAYIVSEDLVEIGYLWWQVGFSLNKNNIRNILNGNYVTGATMAVKREFLVSLIPFPNDVPHDFYIAFTSLLKNSLLPVDEKLIKYRQHSLNVIGIKKRSFIWRFFNAFGRDAVNKRLRSYIEKQQLLDKGVKENPDALNDFIQCYHMYMSIVRFFYCDKIKSSQNWYASTETALYKKLKAYFSFSSTKKTIMNVYDFVFIKIHKNKV
ncbi:glycosyltransferase family 2 protein [Aeromonas caviae]